MTLSFFLSCFVLIIPVFGKAIDYRESLFLYGGIIVFSVISFLYHPRRHLTKKFIIFEIILISLSFLSTIFSQNIGFSYYDLFRFIFSLALLNLCLTYLDTKKLSKYLLYFSLFYSVIFLLNKFHLLIIPLDPSLDDFIPQIWGHSYLADFIIISVPYLLYQIFYFPPILSSKKYFYYFSLLFILITTFLTNSRATIVAITFGTIFLLLPKIPKYLRLIFVSLAIIFAVFLNYQIFSQNRNTKNLNGRRFEYWQQAVSAFIDRPLLGHGPGNFFYINKKYQSTAFTNTNYAHNSLLEYLCLNGLPFTFVFFAVIFFSLRHQYKKHPLNFAIATTALINSFFDPSWNSFGIFCLSLFFIFSQNPHIISASVSKPKNTSILHIIILISIFFISKTISDYLFLNYRFIPSLYIDPFNLNTRTALLPKYTRSTLFLYPHDLRLYQQLVKNFSFPKNEIYYQQIISLAPKENITIYQQLAGYYLSSNNLEKLKDLLLFANQNLNASSFPISQTLLLAKTTYNLALIEWQSQQFSSAINHFQIAANFSQGWSHFQIELANAYWHNGQKDLAKKQLTVECYKFPLSIKHCQEYLTQYPQNFLEPGTSDFRKSINAITP